MDDGVVPKLAFNTKQMGKNREDQKMEREILVFEHKNRNKY